VWVNQIAGHRQVKGVFDLVTRCGKGLRIGVTGMALTATPVGGGLASAVFGAGVAGLHLLLRLAWAECYGRQHLGTIQGVTLPVQLLGQALGPVLSGILFDRTGRYEHVFLGLAGIVLLLCWRCHVGCRPTWRRNGSGVGTRTPDSIPMSTWARPPR
jgi:MFS family permease